MRGRFGSSRIEEPNSGTSVRIDWDAEVELEVEYEENKRRPSTRSTSVYQDDEEIKTSEE